LPQTITIQWQLAAGHYDSYYNISTSKRYEHSYKRQVCPYPFTSTFEQYKRANITDFHWTFEHAVHKYKIAGLATLGYRIHP